MLGMRPSVDPFDAIADDGDGRSVPALEPEDVEEAQRHWRALNDVELPTIRNGGRVR